MNDGVYLPPDEGRAEAFRDGMTHLHDTVAKSGARILLLTPPPYKTGRPQVPKGDYAEVLDGYVKWLDCRRVDGWEIVDIRPGVLAAIGKARAADRRFVYASEGVHPDDDGYRFIADAAYRGLMPLLKLTAEPRYASGEAFGKLKARHKLLKHAWLHQTGFIYVHEFVPAGLPVAEAEKQAAALLAEYRKLSGTTAKASS
jgi:hypothetical protein